MAKRTTHLVGRRGKMRASSATRKRVPVNKPSVRAAQGGHRRRRSGRTAVPVDAMTCAKAAKGGIRRCCNGRGERMPVERADVRGCGGEDTEMLQCCVRTGARGTRARARSRRREGTPVLQWLRENGCPWDAMTCARAAAGGTRRFCSGRLRAGARGTAHAHALREATWRCCSGRVRTDAVDEHTCSAAAKEGHLEVLQWA